MNVSEYLTVNQLASKVQLHPSTIRHEIAEGLLPAVSIGGRYRISAEDAATWLEALKVPAPGFAQPLPLRRGNTKETPFRKLAREMDSAGREAPAEAIQLKEAS
jgi:excisionase family DNA binding protein